MTCKIGKFWNKQTEWGEKRDKGPYLTKSPCNMGFDWAEFWIYICSKFEIGFLSKDMFGYLYYNWLKKGKTSGEGLLEDDAKPMLYIHQHAKVIGYAWKLLNDKIKHSLSLYSDFSSATLPLLSGVVSTKAKAVVLITFSFWIVFFWGLFLDNLKPNANTETKLWNINIRANQFVSNLYPN